MSEKLIDHEYVRRQLYIDGAMRPAPEEDGCGYPTYIDHNASAIDGSRRCGQPRSRHRQAEKAQDCRDDLFGVSLDTALERCAGGERPVHQREYLTAMTRKVGATLAACAGAADPQPGELARTREMRKWHDFLHASVGECHLMISRNTHEFQTEHEWTVLDLPTRLSKIMERAHQAESALTALRTRLEGLASVLLREVAASKLRLVETAMYTTHAAPLSEMQQHQRIEMEANAQVAAKLAAILAETKAPEPSQAERQRDQALLVLKAIQPYCGPCCKVHGARLNAPGTFDPDAIAAFEALRKDGLL